MTIFEEIFLCIYIFLFPKQFKETILNSIKTVINTVRDNLM